MKKKTLKKKVKKRRKPKRKKRKSFLRKNLLVHHFHHQFLIPFRIQYMPKLWKLKSRLTFSNLSIQKSNRKIGFAMTSSNCPTKRITERRSRGSIWLLTSKIKLLRAPSTNISPRELLRRFDLRHKIWKIKEFITNNTVNSKKKKSSNGIASFSEKCMSNLGARSSNSF